MSCLNYVAIMACVLMWSKSMMQELCVCVCGAGGLSSYAIERIVVRDEKQEIDREQNQEIMWD